MTGFRMMAQSKMLWSHRSIQRSVVSAAQISKDRALSKILSSLIWQEHRVPCAAIRKLVGLIDNLDPRRRDAHIRGRHRDLRLLSPVSLIEFLIRPWAYDSGPPSS